jgi:hypothetical protein
MLVPLLDLISKKDWPCQVTLIGFHSLSPARTGLNTNTERETASRHVIHFSMVVDESFFDHTRRIRARKRPEPDG